MIFAAKVDFWFLALFYGFGIFMLLAAPIIGHRARTPARRRRGDAVAAGLLVVLGFLFVGIGWRTSLVNYVITDDGYLDATGWPLNGRIAHVSEIQSIEPSNDPRASHAASLDRLRVDYTRGSMDEASGGHTGLIFIAVLEEEAFLDALAEKDPLLLRTSAGIRRVPRDHNLDVGGDAGLRPGGGAE